MTFRVADLIVDTLIANGVDRAFSVPALLDALYERGEIYLVTCRHEGSARLGDLHFGFRDNRRRLSLWFTFTPIRVRSGLTSITGRRHAPARLLPRCSLTLRESNAAR
ncbi:thiamine pyrophosphate-binding protein [Bradyrhizobium sp. NAS80.1]|uniref:thiamine pyrophosphate-binding protein n=1 Tax=Bradyrhizobium sp. NAS80.1 TaxID=1680159 RepID=UPI0011611F3B